ncbi:MAG TPA: hypothetical protein VHZ03_45485 [Trebonia sp.]|jgi:hypothetical protein|nr:hypothetical protein [Trebonia sp.]
MQVDTGSFRALTARADAVDAIAADVAQIRQNLARAQGVSDAMSEAWIAEGRRREAEERAPRHARPRRPAPGYLRLVGGSR